jgi:hypothetical protein
MSSGLGFAPGVDAVAVGVADGPGEVRPGLGVALVRGEVVGIALVGVPGGAGSTGAGALAPLGGGCAGVPAGLGVVGRVVGVGALGAGAVAAGGAVRGRWPDPNRHPSTVPGLGL